LGIEAKNPGQSHLYEHRGHTSNASWRQNAFYEMEYKDIQFACHVRDHVATVDKDRMVFHAFVPILPLVPEENS
jgi:hypothetical protein